MPLHSLDLNNNSDAAEEHRSIESFAVFLMADCYFKRVFFTLAAALVLIGTILNLFSLYCFLKMNKRHPTNIYLSVLSLGDTINLHANFTLPLLRQSEMIDTAFRSSFGLCRFTGVLTEYFLIFPTWIVVLLTMEPLVVMLCPSKAHASYAQRRTKLSIIILSIIVLALSIYRVEDLGGIDQVSVFTVVACGSEDRSIVFMRHFNLIIWSIVPECLTLIFSLVIVYKIKSAKRHFNQGHSKITQSKYNHVTKTVLLISILFLIFHTPTGLLICRRRRKLNDNVTCSFYS
jgi:hypothetical protein